MNILRNDITIFIYLFSWLIYLSLKAIRQWDQALRERNDYRDNLAKVQRQHEEAVKEINQAMAVRIKASKDIKRLTEERNAAMQVGMTELSLCQTVIGQLLPMLKSH